MPSAGLDALAVQPPRERRRPGVRGLDGRDLQVPLVLSLTMLAGATAFFLLGLFAPVPNITDEAVYLELARHLSLSGSSTILGVPVPTLTYGPAFLALIAPVVRLAGSAHEAYLAIRALNSLVFASAVIPTYLIASRTVSRRAGFIVSAVTIALPAGVYATKVMTESLALTVVIWSMLAAIRAMELPSRRRQLVLVLCIAMLPAVRFELLALGPALAAACLLAAPGGVRPNYKRFSTLLAGTAVVAVTAAVLLHETSGTASAAGAHGFDIHRLSTLRFFQVLVGSLGAIDLYTGVLPFACLTVVIIGILRRDGWITPELRRIALVTSIGAGTLALTSSAYLAAVPAQFRPPIPPDRYTFYLAPAIFIVFAAWLETGARRTVRTTRVALAAGALPILAALAYLGGDKGTFSGLAFLPWVGLGNIHPLLYLVPLAVYCGICTLSLARSGEDTHAFIKPMTAIMPVTLVCAGAFFILAPTSAPPAGWLDAHTARGTVAVWGAAATERKSQALGAIISANKNLSAVYFVREPDTRGFDAVEARVVARSDGLLLRDGRALRAPYVLTEAETRIRGTLIEKRYGFAIYKTGGDVRLAPRAFPAR